ncbi:Uncharacterized protein DBV15_06390, partial [Temnothorax longispinosus]
WREREVDLCKRRNRNKLSGYTNLRYKNADGPFFSSSKGDSLAYTGISLTERGEVTEREERGTKGFHETRHAAPGVLPCTRMQDQDEFYRTLCSSETLRSARKGFFHDFSGHVMETAGDTWTSKIFGRIDDDEGRMRAVFTDAKVKDVVADTLAKTVDQGLSLPLALLGRAEIFMALKEYHFALEDLRLAAEHDLPDQSIGKGRRIAK